MATAPASADAEPKTPRSHLRTGRERERGDEERDRDGDIHQRLREYSGIPRILDNFLETAGNYWNLKRHLEMEFEVDTFSFKDLELFSLSLENLYLLSLFTL